VPLIGALSGHVDEQRGYHQNHQAKAMRMLPLNYGEHLLQVLSPIALLAVLVYPVLVGQFCSFAPSYKWKIAISNNILNQG
jgi:hypothetical protein